MKTHTTHYKNINILLATKHHKEFAIQAPFNDTFRASIYVPNDYNTDELGTFSGEVERTGTPYETVIEKASRAMKKYDFSYAIASEGSFGPHPGLFFLAADIELMSFIDTRNNLTIVVSEITTETNFAHLDVSRGENYEDFLTKIKFGTHGLIIKDMTRNTVLAKGITEREKLDAIIETSLKNADTIRLETDMRAMMNPTRMHVIHRLAQKLCTRLQQICPMCDSPGFGKVSVNGNLPCRECGTQTELYQSKFLHCIKCSHFEELPRDDGATHADAQYCSYCNP